MNLSIKQEQTHIHRVQTWVAKSEERLGGGISRHKLLYRMFKQQGPTVQNRDVYSISFDKP